MCVHVHRIFNFFPERLPSLEATKHKKMDATQQRRYEPSRCGRPQKRPVEESSSQHQKVSVLLKFLNYNLLSQKSPKLKLKYP